VRREQLPSGALIATRFSINGVCSHLGMFKLVSEKPGAAAKDLIFEYVADVASFECKAMAKRMLASLD